VGRKLECKAAGKAMKRKLADALVENNNDLKSELEAF
jgi:hypothetical protein